MAFTIENAIALMIATAFLGLAPGPAVFATISKAINLPFSKTAFFIAGIVLGDFLFAMLAMGGLSVFVSQYQIIFSVLRYIGAAYLLYLGVSALISKPSMKKISSTIPHSYLKLIVSGFLLTATNPKDLLFFLSFLPAFIDLKIADAKHMIMAALVVVVTFTVTLTFYATLFTLVRGWLCNYQTLCFLNRIAALILIGVGLTVLFGY